MEKEWEMVWKVWVKRNMDKGDCLDKGFMEVCGSFSWELDIEE